MKLVNQFCKEAERATEGGMLTHDFEYKRDDSCDVWECWFCGVEARLPYDNDVPFEEMWRYISKS